jgi:excisionase family DNA binding protein
MELLKPGEIAKILKLSEPYIYKLISRGAMPHFRFGRAVRVAREDLENYFATRRQVGVRYG